MSFLSNISIDLHQVLVLRQYIFVLVMEKLTRSLELFKIKSLGCMPSANDIVLECVCLEVKLDK